MGLHGGLVLLKDLPKFFQDQLGFYINKQIFKINQREKKQLNTRRISRVQYLMGLHRG
jgi:hypothetical protein